jgi:hypothetical protein
MKGMVLFRHCFCTSECDTRCERRVVEQTFRTLLRYATRVAKGGLLSSKCLGFSSDLDERIFGVFRNIFFESDAVGAESFL